MTLGFHLAGGSDKSWRVEAYFRGGLSKKHEGVKKKGLDAGRRAQPDRRNEVCTRGGTRMNGQSLSREQLAGQRLMVGFDGTALNSDLKHLIGGLKVGGIILFSRNIVSPDQLESLCRSVQDHAASCNQPPLFIAIDQEGGMVARLKPPFTQFPGNPAIRGEDDAMNFARVTAAELTRVGINMNMAPVLDVMPYGIPGIMAGRVFGNDPHWVARMGLTVIRHLQQNNIMAVAKHFPGIGRTVADSHHEMPILRDELPVLEFSDLIPFRAAAAYGVAGIMLSHILYESIDSRWPASLSAPIARTLLRDRVGYDGVAITDDLDMGAIAGHFPFRTVVRQVLFADVDIALICHQGPNIGVAFEEIVKAMADDARLRLKAEESVRRIMRRKREYLAPSVYRTAARENTSSRYSEVSPEMRWW